MRPILLIFFLFSTRTAHANWQYDTTCHVGRNAEAYLREWRMSHNEDPLIGFAQVSPSGYMDASVVGDQYAPGFYWYATTCPIQKPFDANGLMYKPAVATEAVLDDTDTIVIYSPNFLCTFARYHSGSCMQHLFKCPVCQPWETPLGGCAGLAHSSQSDDWRPCRACGQKILNSNRHVWQGPTCAANPRDPDCTTGCKLVTCPNGYTSNYNAHSECTPCTSPGPSDAAWSPTVACEWTCPTGKYYDSGANSCFDCSPLPSGAVMDPGMPFGGGRDDLSSCLHWKCPAGTRVGRNACVSCPADQYQSTPAQQIACEGNCYLKLWGSGIACEAGSYAVFDTVTCAVLRCEACTPAPPAGFYWALDPQFGWSATAVNRCIVRPCPTVSPEPGKQYVGCGGSSPGVLVPCTNLPVWYGDRGNTTIPALYYSANCDTAACATCTSPDMFNPFCPAKGGPSTRAGECTATCSIITNGYHLAARPAPVADLSDCPFACLPGYTASGAQCVPCTNSSTCDAGFYVAACSERCQACPTVYSGGLGRWAKTNSPTYGTAFACQWLCNVGYYKDAARSTCATCTTASCGVGAYRTGQCLIAEDAVADSVCLPCDGVVDAQLTSTGSLSATSCAYQCNAGFFTPSAASRQCVPWTPSGTCPNTATLRYNWTGGSPTADHRCVLCPNLPQSDPSTVQWALSPPCTWVCAAGYYRVAPLKCDGCPPGTYGNASGLPCVPCPDGTYNANYGAQQCMPVPGNSTRLAGAIGFQCLPSYRRDLMGIACAQCVPGAASAADALQRLNMVSAVWRVEQCARSAFTCAQGYYRTPTTEGNCLRCPALPVGALSGGSSARAVSLCGAWPSCSPPSDELAAACAPSACVPGYYLTYVFANASDSLLSGLCVACSTVTGGCPSSYTAAPCQGGQQQNPCVQCAALPVAVGLLYVDGSGCALGCAAGYAYASANTCVACPAGTYQPTTGITSMGSSCPSCAAGTYSDATTASACLACAPGWRSPIQGASACVPCEAGKFANVSGANACAACPANAYAPAGATACVVCPLETPIAINGDTCVAPSGASCPAGFFRLPNTTLCAGCPEGTYCPAGNSSAPFLCPSGTPPAPRLSASAAACKAGAPGAWRTVAGDPVPCPAYTSTYNLTGATSSAWCYPLRGYYGLPGVAAQPCPYDAYCPPPARTFTKCPPATPFAPLLSTSAANCTNSMRQPCRPGYYVPWNALSTAACLLCPNGSYCLGQTWPNGTRIPSQTASGSNVLACPSGGAWYTDAGAHAATMCRSQPLLTLALSCGNAIPNSVAGTTSSIVSPLQCRASQGFYMLPGATPVWCPTGYYCPTYGTEPLPCVVATSCPDPSTQIDLSPCSAQGSMTRGQPCIPCSNGATLPIGGYWATNCMPCCNAGYIASSSGVCVEASSACPGSGVYRPALPACASNLLACTACPASPVAGAVGIASATNVFGVAACRYACPNGSCASAPVLNVNSTPGACAPASPGHYAVNGVCTPCPAGKYRYESGGTACMACPHGASTASLGSTLCACGAGNYSLYASGVQQCVPCSPGTVVVAGSGCQTCAAGAAWTPFSQWITGACGPGTFRATPASACQPCALGAYANGTEATACVACAAGTYAATTGLTACTACAAAGTYAQPTYGCAPCPMNGSVAGQCTCPAGTFLEGALCLACASRCAGNSTFVVARTRNASGCKNAGVDASDFACAASPAACPERTYYDAVARRCVNCRTCPALATAVSTCAVNSTRDTTRCVCPLGYYYRWGDCFPCTRTCGQYAVLASLCALGATEDTSVCACAGGAYGNGVQCVCPALTYRHPANGTCVACQKCPANTTYAAICLEGATNDTTRCLAFQCGVGTYTPAQGKCIACASGTYATGLNLSACLTCAKGTYSNVTGATACQKCPRGTYGESTGAYACVACPMGTFSASSTACLACSIGRFGNTSGLSACLACEAGTYLDRIDDTACTACAAGKYSALVGAWKPSSSASPNMGALVSTNGFPVNAGTGQYCSQMHSAYDFWSDWDGCYPIGGCPWSEESGACQFIERYYIYTEGYHNVHYNCVAACLRTASCTNGANGVFMGPGVYGNSASCPITCNPGFNLSASNYCVAPPICLDCAYATRAGATACAP